MLDYEFLTLFSRHCLLNNSGEKRVWETRSLMLKCFSSVGQALKFITLAVYLTAVIATGVD